MPKLATWIQPKDEKWFRPFFAAHPEIQVENAIQLKVSLAEMDGLLLTGGADISKEFLRQPVQDPSVLEKDVNPERDRWEFNAVREAMDRALPIFAICKGMQLFNVALGGTLKLDIAGHNRPEMRDHNVQPLRNDRHAAHRFVKVNSSHHQAVDQLGEGLEVEAWCATDDIIEQMRLRDYPYALAVQYHPERDALYTPLFEDFLSRVEDHAVEALKD
jgi:putative glutamine amidotransferase